MERARVPRVLDEYVERHHVIPRALRGSNDPSNVVVLTFREHFLAHWLLTKFVIAEGDRRKMQSALWRTVHQYNLPTHVIAKWRYPIAKRAHRDSQVGSTHTPEHTAKQAAKLRGVPKAPDHIAKVAKALTGKRHSDEAKARMRVAQVKSPEQRAKIAKSLTGHKRSQTSIDNQKATLATKDRSKSPKTIENMRLAALRRYQKPGEKERMASIVKEALKDVDRSGANNPRFGVTLSDETKALIAQRLTERGGYRGANNPNYRHGRDVQT
jgi:hypothetical protein